MRTLSIAAIEAVDSAAKAADRLSTEAWGAILIITLFVFGVAVFCMARYIRQLHKTIVDLADRRVKDANEHAVEAQEAATRSLEVSIEATQSIRDLQNKVHSMEKVSRALQEKVDCRLCPARAQGGRP